MPRNADVLIVANRLSRGLVNDTWSRADVEYIMDVLKGNEAKAARILIEHSTTNKVFRLEMLAANLKQYAAARSGKRISPVVREMSELMLKLSDVLTLTHSEYRKLMVTPEKKEKIVVSLETMQKLKGKKA